MNGNYWSNTPFTVRGRENCRLARVFIAGGSLSRCAYGNGSLTNRTLPETLNEEHSDIRADYGSSFIHTGEGGSTNDATGEACDPRTARRFR